MPLYVLLILILFYQVFILHRVSFICDCTYEYVCNVSSPATEAEYINNNSEIMKIRRYDGHEHTPAS